MPVVVAVGSRLNHYDVTVVIGGGAWDKRIERDEEVSPLRPVGSGRGLHVSALSARRAEPSRVD